ncbi:MAG: Hint domain-containing protein [Pirellulaceae bacterium]|nr:Hint domain-containing protein [Pirellulaceae bacterium]
MSPKAPRRWLSFSLRTMFIVVTAICCWLGWESSVVRGRQALLKELRSRPSVQVTAASQWVASLPPGTSRNHRASVPLHRRWLGDEAIQEIGYGTHYQPLSTTELSRVARVFPEARLYEQQIAMEPCHPGCFPRGTLVDTPTGPRLIESLQPGDQVTAIGHGRESLTATVQSVFITENVLWKVRTQAGELLTTRIQPLCLADGSIAAAGDLKPGDHILQRQENVIRPVKVLEVSPTQGSERVFNVVLGNSEIFVAGGHLARSKPPAESVAK